MFCTNFDEKMEGDGMCYWQQMVRFWSRLESRYSSRKFIKEFCHCRI